MASQVTTRGQITIDRAIRRQLGVRPGMIAHQRVVDGRLEVLFLPAPHKRSLSGTLHRPGETAKLLTNDEIEATVGKAIAQRNARRAAGLE